MPIAFPRLAAVAAVVAALAAVPAGAAASAAEPHVAIDAGGTAHFAWRHYDGGVQLVRTRSRAQDGALSEIEYASPGSAYVSEHALAPLPAGSALHLWRESSGAARVRRQAADGSFGPAQTIATELTVVPRFATDPAGNAVFVWSRAVSGKLVIETRRRAANGTLGAVKRLSAAAPTYSAFRPAVAVDASGDAVFAWQVAASPPFIQVRARASDGTLSAVQNLTSGAGAEAPAVGVDSAGNAVIAFRRNKPDGVWMQVRRRSATGALAPTADISTSPTNLLFEPRVAVSPAAGAVVGWQQLVEGKAIIHAAHRAPGGAWTQPQPITPLGTPAYLPRLDVDDDGNAVFAWHVGDEVRSRRRAADGALSPIDDLTAAPAMIDGLDLAVEAGGSAVVGWTALVDGKQGMHARRRTPTGELSVPQVLSD